VTRVIAVLSLLRSTGYKGEGNFLWRGKSHLDVLWTEEERQKTPPLFPALSLDG